MTYEANIVRACTSSSVDPVWSCEPYVTSYTSVGSWYPDGSGDGGWGDGGGGGSLPDGGWGHPYDADHDGKMDCWKFVADKPWSYYNLGYCAQWGATSPPCHRDHTHTGIDIPVYKKNVRAIADGTVVKIDRTGNSGTGRYVKIKHDHDPYYSFYAHLARISHGLS